jgi:hypothetical protein
MCLITVIGLVVIGIVAPDLFKTILERLKDIANAIFPNVVQTFI